MVKNKQAVKRWERPEKLHKLQDTGEEEQGRWGGRIGILPGATRGRELSSFYSEILT